MTELPEHIRKNFVTDIDGFVYYWPEGSNGHYASHHLRQIADELDKINAPHEREINEFFEQLEKDKHA